jgi:type III pantothenate kinase
MLLTLDVGNTNIAIGIFNGEDLVGDFRMMSRTERTADEMAMTVLDFLHSQSIDAKDIQDVVISSVVPPIGEKLGELFQKYFSLEPLYVNYKAETGIKILADNPREVGADRIVNVTAGHALYKRSCIIIDFGTATTFDYVTENGEFQYTVIMPGLEISARALSGKTAKLPQVEISKPASILASNTVDGMQAGIVYGYIGAVEYTISQMKKELKDDPYVVATGGLGRVIAEESPLIDLYNPHIAYEGMKVIYKNSKDIKEDLPA